MMSIRRYVTIFIIVFSLCPLDVHSQTFQQNKSSGSEKAAPFTPELVQRQIERVNSSKIDTLMHVLGIKPGMIILDLGAGSGQYAYEFAERLKGTGKVFAADIDINMVHYMKQQAQARNLVNFFPVLVDKEGLDEFFTKNRFDLIFVAHAYSFFSNRVDYFNRLKDHLAKNGRLVIMENKGSQKFSLYDISNFDGLIRQLSLENSDSPFYANLQESTRELLRQPLDNKTKELLKKAIVDDFNQMRDDFSFLSNFLKNGSTFKREVAFIPEEKEFVERAFRFLKFEAGVLDNTGALDMTNKNVNIEHKHFTCMRIINTVLIVQKFRRYLYNGKPAPYLSGGFGNWQKAPTIIRELQLAGYRLKQKYDFVPFDMILVFTPNNGIR
ncbi:MAG: class I SAM-dependent methyltransferase [Candidatus Omnitrophica bacterium]|nr:class I SAM-dependent methyltransferase [Candidatus Omnitrophota bacterium]